jgi:thiamine-monophosphate kinase
VHPFTDQPAESVAALGECGLIKAARRWLGSVCPPAPYGIGDDCAVLPPFPGAPLLTVDPVIYGEHFDDRMTAAAAGAKLMKRNLSDLAAMGGAPVAAVVALALAPTLRVRWLAGFYRGLAAAARRHGVPVVGGDIARQGEGFTATLTLLGRATGPRVLTRTGARVGDRVYVTGELGGSLAGHHWRFTPRLPEGRWLARQAGVRALLDVSDGLGKDLAALVPAGARAVLDPAAIPIRPAARRAARASGRPVLAHALGDGEDYELVFTVDRRVPAAAFARRWARAFPKTRLSAIGRLVAAAAAAPGMIDLADYRGFEHLRSPSPDARQTPTAPSAAP